MVVTNAQQQMKVNSQQQPAQLFNGPTRFQSQQVQQAPMNYNQPVNISVPPGMSNQNQVQFIQQQQPVTHQVFGGMYGRRQQQHVPVKHPDVFNDDEAIIEKVKE